jgi:uncharacterized small protein (DUF1192 family)
MKKLFLVFALFIFAAPLLEAGPLGMRPLSGLSQGGPRARIASMRARIQERRANRQARKAAKAAAAAPAAAVAPQ